MKKGEKKKLNKAHRQRTQDKLARKRAHAAAPMSALFHLVVNAIFQGERR